MLANIIIDYFLKGGPIMYPILVVAIVAVCVVGERAFWWMRLGMRRDPETLEQIKGMGPHKVRMYGEQFLKAVQEQA